MSGKPIKNAGLLVVQNGIFLTLTAVINRVMYTILYFFKSSQFRAKAWYASWIILRAFDRRSYYKRIIIFCSTMCVVTASLIIILTKV